MLDKGAMKRGGQVGLKGLSGRMRAEHEQLERKQCRWVWHFPKVEFSL